MRAVVGKISVPGDAALFAAAAMVSVIASEVLGFRRCSFMGVSGAGVGWFGVFMVVAYVACGMQLRADRSALGRRTQQGRAHWHDLQGRDALLGGGYFSDYSDCAGAGDCVVIAEHDV